MPKITNAASAHVAALHTQFSVNAEQLANRTDTKARVDGAGLLYFSSKAPGLKSIITGKKDKLQAVKNHLDGIATHFECRRYPADPAVNQRLTTEVRNSAAELSRRVVRAQSSGGDITAGDFRELRNVIARAVDVSEEMANAPR
jgi:hypothetical protein